MASSCENSSFPLNLPRDHKSRQKQRYIFRWNLARGHETSYTIVAYSVGGDLNLVEDSEI